MTQRYRFSDTSSPEQQLLAISIVLLKLLRSHPSLTLKVPLAIHQALPSSCYGEVLYDTLSAEHVRLETRLHLSVHPADHFEINFSS